MMSSCWRVSAGYGKVAPQATRETSSVGGAQGAGPDAYGTRTEQTRGRLKKSHFEHLAGGETREGSIQNPSNRWRAASSQCFRFFSSAPHLGRSAHEILSTERKRTSAFIMRA
jgi:hypothetical protein